MKRLAIFALCLAILAAPCVYDVASTEPSPLSAGFLAAGLASTN